MTHATMTPDRKHQFLWFDLETTGLDPAVDLILEWALVLCEDDGPEESGPNEPDRGMAIVQSFSGVISYGPSRIAELRRSAHPIVQGMHEVNGLWDLAAQGPDADGVSTLEQADDFLRSFCVEFTGQPKPTGLVLAGASVHFDLSFARVHLPRFARCLSHRVFDVSTLTQAERSWGYAIGDSSEGGGGQGEHRALPDVLHSIKRAAEIRARRWRA